MQSPWKGTLIGYYRDDLPHWVMDYGCYAITMRCKGSLPIEVVERLESINQSLQALSCPTAEADALRRQLFYVLESFLDQGTGFAPFRRQEAAAAFQQQLVDYMEDDLRFAHFVVMPNHVHLLTCPIRFEDVDHFKSVFQRFKARSARLINSTLGRSGALWQSSWYDRWIRDEVEFGRWQRYLEQNPIKAGLCEKASEYPWRR